MKTIGIVSLRRFIDTKKLVQVRNYTHDFLLFFFFFYMLDIHTAFRHVRILREKQIRQSFAFTTELTAGCFAARIDQLPIIIRTSEYLLPPR